MFKRTKKIKNRKFHIKTYKDNLVIKYLSKFELRSETGFIESNKLKAFNTLAKEIIDKNRV